MNKKLKPVGKRLRMDWQVYSDDDDPGKIILKQKEKRLKFKNREMLKDMLRRQF